MGGRWLRTETHKKFDKQNTMKQKQKEPVFHLSAFLWAGWHTCFQWTFFFSRQNQMKSLSQLVKQIQKVASLFISFTESPHLFVKLEKLALQPSDCIVFFSDVFECRLLDWRSGSASLVPFQIGAWKVFRRGFHIPGTAEQFPVGRRKSRGADESNYAEYLIRSSKGLFQQYERSYLLFYHYSLQN